MSINDLLKRSSSHGTEEAEVAFFSAIEACGLFLNQ